ncbi:hypothetical protein B7494_g1449 [Chlorociboria aeruginascens]|nr:hypothetical protein B7494_g1449 [Chlorociboria aeruginascens]
MARIEKVDLAVIGTGTYGLVAAKTYLEVNPSSNVVLFDIASTIGGVWGVQRLHPGLKTNNLLGTYEYSDFPMDPQVYGVKPGQHIPGPVLHRYLSDYAQKFDIFRRIQFNTNVESAEHQDGGGWIIAVCRTDTHKLERQKLFARKLIIATGMTSDPIHPMFRGVDEFGAPLFHFKHMPQHINDLASTQRVSVFSGGKAAWDAVYLNASNGRKVDWVIRESGHGPAWMVSPYVTPFKKRVEALVHIRFLTWLSPCIWGNCDGFPGIRAFFHETVIGRFLVDKFWGILESDALSINKYDNHPETAKLKPWSRLFFTGTSFSLLNYSTDIFEFIRNGTVKVHIADITGLDPKTVCLSNGERIPTDALIYATGWSPSPPLKFLPEGLNLGLPHESGSSEPLELIERADKEILSRFPRLKVQPTPNPKHKKPLATVSGAMGYASPKKFEPYRLHRFMIPPAFLQSRDIAFVGSFFSGQIPIPSDVEYETVLHSQFGKWRYPDGYSEKCPDIVFDLLPYIDMLLGDLGLRIHRKAGFISEIFSPYIVKDYKGLIGEWMASRGKTGA